ncbi:MAG: diguanylate cyclase [Anaerolineae bacterium]|nr:diguanylate cyclase [Anaerolineae bacterium]
MSKIPKQNDKISPSLSDLWDKERERLKILRKLNILDTPPEQVYDDFVTLAAQICETPIALITLVDQDRQWFKANLGLDVDETHRSVAFCSHAIKKPDEILIVQDALLDNRFSDNPLVKEEPHIRFYAGAPLVTDEGYALGTLCVIDRIPRKLSAEQIAALRALRRTVMSEIELRRTKIILENLHQRQNALAEINLSINQPHELQLVLDRIVASVTNFLPASGGSSVILWDKEQEAFTYSASTIPQQTPQMAAYRVRKEKGATRWIVENCQSIYVENIRHDPFTANTMLTEYGLQSYAGVPIESNGIALGVLYALDKETKKYSSSDIDFLMALARRAATAIINVRLFEHIKLLSITDALTGLLSRKEFLLLAEREFERAKRKDHPLTAIMLDIDNFKHFNDSYGHLIGDEILKTVGEICRNSFRIYDILGRFGGDEIAIILPETSSEIAIEIMDRVRKELLTIEINDWLDFPKTTLSIGVAEISEK